MGERTCRRRNFGASGEIDMGCQVCLTWGIEYRHRAVVANRLQGVAKTTDSVSVVDDERRTTSQTYPFGQRGDRMSSGCRDFPDVTHLCLFGQRQWEMSR